MTIRSTLLKRARRSMIGLTVVLVIAGCAKSGVDLAPVEGRITLDGEPLAFTDISFQPDGQKSPSVCRTDGDGRYVLYYKRGVQGGMIGQNTVRIQTVAGVSAVRPLPDRYNKNTELRREVVRGKNTFDFELTTTGK